jgi:hypothetical protein
MWGSSSSQTDRQYWAVDSITAALVSLPAHSHPRQRPSRLCCVRQSPQPSSIPPGAQAAERTRKRLHTVTCYHPRPGRSGATQIGLKRAFPIKLKNGLTSSRVQTDLRPPRSISVHAQLNPIFMSIGGPQAHENSKPPPVVPKTPLVALPEPIYFAVSKMADSALSEKTWFRNPDPSFHIANNRGHSWRQKGIRQRNKTRCPPIPRRGL